MVYLTLWPLCFEMGFRWTFFRLSDFSRIRRFQYYDERNNTRANKYFWLFIRDHSSFTSAKKFVRKMAIFVDLQHNLSWRRWVASFIEMFPIYLAKLLCSENLLQNWSPVNSNFNGVSRRDAILLLYPISTAFWLVRNEQGAGEWQWGQCKRYKGWLVCFHFADFNSHGLIVGQLKLLQSKNVSLILIIYSSKMST